MGRAAGRPIHDAVHLLKSPPWTRIPQSASDHAMPEAWHQLGKWNLLKTRLPACLHVNLLACIFVYMLTVAVVNQKGGVGKSTTVLGLASAARQAKVPALVIDMDPQANITAALDVDGDGFTTNDVLYANAKGCAADALWETTWGPLVTCIPANLELAERDSDTTLGSEQRLRKALDDPDLQNRFQLALIDCPPSVGRLVSNSLIAADLVLIVTEPSYPASQGVANLLDTIATVREHYNPELTVAGVVVNKVPARVREAEFRLTELIQSLDPDTVWLPPIPTRAILSEAFGARTPIHDYGARSKEIASLYDDYLQRLLTKGTST